MWPRRSGRGRLASVQEQLPLDEILGDVLLLRGGEARAVLEARPVNFALKSEGEQEAILAGYRRFLNALDYPLQVLVRVARADVEGYLAGLAHARPGSEGMRRLARDHRAFVRHIARERTLLGRRFFVVLPAERIPGPRGAPPGAPAWRGLLRRRGRSPEQRRSGLAEARRTLSFRSSEVTRGLGSFGVEARRLSGEELAALFREALAPAGAPRTPPPATPAVTAVRSGREAAGA